MMTDDDIDDVELDEGYMLQERIGIVTQGHEPSIVISALTSELALNMVLAAKGDPKKIDLLRKLCGDALVKLVNIVLDGDSNA